MAQKTNEAIVRRYWRAHAAHDYDALESLRHADWTVEWPQTGELVRGHAHDQAIAYAYLGGPPDMALSRVVGSDDRWAMCPRLPGLRFNRATGGLAIAGRGARLMADSLVATRSALRAHRRGSLVHRARHVPRVCQRAGLGTPCPSSRHWPARHFRATQLATKASANA